MAEYIDRDLLKRAVHASDLENREKMALLTCISSIPAADVEPVRHGHWEDVGGGYVACSECGEEHSWVSYRPDLCPDCGAKMDGE